MSRDISNLELLLILAGWVSATSALHHRKAGEELHFSPLTGYWSSLNVHGRAEALLAVVLLVLAVLV